VERAAGSGAAPREPRDTLTAVGQPSNHVRPYLPGLLIAIVLDPARVCSPSAGFGLSAALDFETAEMGGPEDLEDAKAWEARLLEFPR
jgi:hypothetical protein